jgi:hypothetical protein
MKNAFVLTHDWLKYSEGISKQSYEDMKGQCVYELLIERLKNYWTTINKDKLFQIFEEYVESKNEYLVNEPYNGNFDMNSGVDCQMIDIYARRKIFQCMHLTIKIIVS